jgi:NAD(P)-dependent dehydrogenase (short-subunit alcohol dehydrogenase family)
VSQSRKVALVTGASRGIGREIALQLAGDGTDLVLVARPSEDLESTRRACEAAGARAESWPLDLGDTATLEKGIAEGMQRIGRVDYLVNNAGVTRDGLLVRMKREDWDRVFAVNLTAAFLVTRGECGCARVHRDLHDGRARGPGEGGAALPGAAAAHGNATRRRCGSSLSPERRRILHHGHGAQHQWRIAHGMRPRGGRQVR